METTPTNSPEATDTPVTVRHLTADDRPALYDLRLRILRPNRPPEAAHFPGDDAPTTLHLGAFLPDGTCVGILTLVENNGLQLRGMAVDTNVQKQGVGAAILREAQRVARERGYSEIWCNARVYAMPFYARAGWVAEGDEFEVPDVGPHYVMRKQL